MSDQNEDIGRVWAILDQAGAGMLTTQYQDGLRARPIEPRPEHDFGLIWFVTDVRGRKDDDIEGHHRVCLAIALPRDNIYLSISGTAEVRRDAAKARAIWRKTDDAWWPDGPSDPNVRVIRFVPEIAELWDGPSSIVGVAYEFAKAKLTGAPPALGENRKTTVTMR